MWKYLLNLNFDFSFRSIAGTVFIVIAALCAFFTDRIIKVFLHNKSYSDNTPIIIKFAAIALCAIGAILIIR